MTRGSKAGKSKGFWTCFTSGYQQHDVHDDVASGGSLDLLGQAGPDTLQLPNGSVSDVVQEAMGGASQMRKESGVRVAERINVEALNRSR